jgi:hypothetical protein
VRKASVTICLASSLILAGAFGPELTAAESVKCRHGHTLLKTREVRVISVASLNERVIYACGRLNGTRVQLGRSYVHDNGSTAERRAVGPIRAAGHFVAAWSTVSNSLGETSATLLVGNIRRRALDSPRVFPGKEPGAVVVTNRGYFAFTVPLDRSRSSGCQVERIRAGGEETLDGGPDLDCMSLKIAGSSVTWTKGGVTYSRRID